MKKIVLATVLLFAYLMITLEDAAEPVSQGWENIYLENELIKLQIVPEIGGRVIQYSLGGYGFFWVNQQLVGKRPPAGGLGPNGQWLNYGGDKLWPAPQGWDGEHQWPGPPDAVLDGGPYTARIIKQNNKVVAVRLTSHKDKQSGIQFSRTIRIFDNTTHVSVDATMKNIDTKDRRWGIWSHTQFNAGNRYGDGYNKNYWAYCPLNPDSVFPRGYGVIFGLAQNSQFKPDYKNGMMRVHYQRRVGKIGLDSDAGWIATVDGTDGYCFVQRFKFEKGKTYPDNSSVEFWTNGSGEIFAYNKIIKMTEDLRQNPYNFESEMIGPYAHLKPGQSSSFHYDWYAAKIGPNMPVVGCSELAVTCKPLSARLEDARLTLSGHYGLFQNGYIQLVLLDENNREIKKAQKRLPVTPLRPVDLSGMSELTAGIDVPETAQKAALCVYDTTGQVLGELATAKILKN